MTTAHLQFPRHARLLSKPDFQAIFQHADCKSSDQSMTLLARRNGLDYARLGMAVGKRVDKKAVVRNRVKRQVRESFRHHQQNLSGLDIVVLGREGASRMENSQLMKSLQAHWQKVVDQCAKS